MNTVETRIRTTSTHPAIEARLAAAARLAREATSRHTCAQACRAVVDALSAPALEFEGIALTLEQHDGAVAYQVVAGTWPPAPSVAKHALLTVPLLLDDARIGELTVYRMHAEAFAEADAALITAAAAHASLGVARARLMEEVARLNAKAAAAKPNGTLRRPRPAAKKRGARAQTSRRNSRKSRKAR